MEPKCHYNISDRVAVCISTLGHNKLGTCKAWKPASIDQSLYLSGQGKVNLQFQQKQRKEYYDGTQMKL